MGKRTVKTLIFGAALSCLVLEASAVQVAGKIPFISTGTGFPEVWVIDEHGGSQRQVTHMETSQTTDLFSRKPDLVKVADLPGGDIMDIEFVQSSPHVVYLVSEPNAMGLWRSDDVGETWRQVFGDFRTGGPAHISDMSVHPGNPDVVLVADAHALWKMVLTDGSVQRKLVYPPPGAGGATSVFAVAFSPSTPSVVYAADVQGNILKSTDGGDTWQAVAQLDVVSLGSLAVDPSSPDTLYAGTSGQGGGLFKSTDGGQNWQEVLQESDLVVSAAAGNSDLVFAYGGTGIFKSTDGGTTWRRTLDRPAYSVRAAPSNPRVVYAGTPEGALQSNDGGETWINRSTGIEYPSVGRLAVHPDDPNTVITDSFFSNGTSGEGIYKTTDGGLLWTRKGRDFVDMDVIEVAVDPDNPNVVYAGTACSRGIYRSEDGGASWALLPPGPRWASHYTMRIATAPGSIVWLTGLAVMEWSNDGGRSWYSALDEQNRHVHGIAISPHDPKLVFVGTAGHDPGTTYYPGARILRTTDRGETWREMRRGFPSGENAAIEDFAFDPFNPEVIYVAASSHHGNLSTALGIYKSTDGGKSWMQTNAGLDSRDVHSIVISPTTPALVYAGTTAGVFRLRRRGDSWAYIGLPKYVHRLFVDPVKPGFLYAGTDKGLFWSRNRGNTWRRLKSVPAKPVTGLAIDASGKVLYVAVNRVGIFKAVLRGKASCC